MALLSIHFKPSIMGARVTGNPERVTGNPSRVTGNSGLVTRKTERVTGNPERSRWLHLGHACSQTRRRICFILAAAGDSQIIKEENN